MDIRQAKEELRRMVLAYTERTEDGQLRIPMLHQRPALLMGPPGVGKTAILSQLADELHIGLVAYTMTHHTRQSALGLPLIREKQYGGKDLLRDGVYHERNTRRRLRPDGADRNGSRDPLPG